MTLIEAIALFRQCEEFQETGKLPECSLRSLAKETFGRDSVLCLNQICADVYRKLAQAYMEGR